MAPSGLPPHTRAHLRFAYRQLTITPDAGAVLVNTVAGLVLDHDICWIEGEIAWTKQL